MALVSRCGLSYLSTFSIKILKMQFFWALRSYSIHLSHTANIMSYLSAAQQYLTNETKENIMKVIIIILIPPINFSS